MSEHLVQLRKLLVEHLNDDELRTLCFDLSVDYENLPATGKASKARELLAYIDRHGYLPEFLTILQQERPDVAWAETALADGMNQLVDDRERTDQARNEMRERQKVVNSRPLDATHTFKDRLSEAHALYEHLVDANVRLISVVGRSGMGKTALVSHVLAELEHGRLLLPERNLEYPVDGLVYLSARSTGLSLERIYTDVARMLGQPRASTLASCWADQEISLIAKVEFLLRAMQTGAYLILLDNLEDVLTQNGTIQEDGLRLFVEHCLTQSSGARLVVTSREQVRFAVGALQSVRDVLLREGLPEGEAMALLRELDPQGTLGLRDESASELSRAIRLTRGIPRALEILAGILRMDQTINLRQLLSDERLFDEQVVSKLVSAGYQRLSKGEQQVMEALAVFDTPVGEIGIRYLLHPWSPNLNARACLQRLTNSWFVSANRVTAEYSLHPLDREYAYHQIPVQMNKTDNAYTRRDMELRTADFYASIRKPQDIWRTIDDLLPQMAEFKHRVRAQDYDGACRVLEPIDADYLYLWGHYAWLATSRESLLGHLNDPGLQASNLANLGRAYRVIGKVEQAIEVYQEGLSIARQIADRINEQHLLRYLGTAYRVTGHIRQSIEFYEQARIIVQEIGDHKSETECIGSLGTAYFELGQFERAISLYEEALALAREIGDRLDEGDWIGHLGRVYRGLGQTEKAIGYLETSLLIAREIGAHAYQNIRLGNLGDTYIALGQPEQAIRYYEEGLVIAREIGYRPRVGRQLLGMARASLANGKPTIAQQYCVEALSSDEPKFRHQVVLVLGIALLQQGDLSAHASFVDAAERAETILGRTADLYEAQYTLAAARVGCAVCAPQWSDITKRADLLIQALREYSRALEICPASGIVQDALWNMKMIHEASIEGLEPVFSLLEAACTDWPSNTSVQYLDLR